jgi:hypothetical protein
MTLAYDLGGNDLIVNSITTGASSPGQAVATGISATTPIVIGAATTLKSNVTAVTATSNIATVTNYLLQVTTPSLSTAAGAAQTEVITLTGLAATDIAFVQLAGGTSTVTDVQISAVCTTNTLTITLTNTGPSAALNGTVILNVWILKA